VALRDLTVVVDILNVIMHEQSVWNLDLCVVLLPLIFDLIQSDYGMYMTVGCESLKWILRNFAQVINTNLQVIGVDIV
jgi:katanin p80 WD40 repeat-containing subunit B1